MEYPCSVNDDEDNASDQFQPGRPLRLLVSLELVCSKMPNVCVEDCLLSLCGVPYLVSEVSGCSARAGLFAAQASSRQCVTEVFHFNRITGTSNAVTNNMIVILN